MDSDVGYFVTYPCPGCSLELEAQHGGWEGWLRCPACGTPALPPEILLGHPNTRRRIRGLDGHGPMTPSPEPDAPGDGTVPDPSELIGPPPSALVGALRLIFLTGLVMSLFLLLIGYLDQNQRAAGIFGALAVLFLLLLLRTPSRRRRPAPASVPREPIDGRASRTSSSA